MTSTRLLLGGRIYSPSHPDATAMAVRGATVIWLGDDDVGRAEFPHAEVVGLDGALVAPAFVDSHVHLTATGLTGVGLDLTAARSGRECVRLLAEYAAGCGDRIVWGHGWDDTHWADGPPDTGDLDAAAAGKPVYLTRVDAHSALASTALRQRAAGLPAAPGYAERAPLTGDAHHLVREQARLLLTAEQRAGARTAALDAAAAAGVVAVHECAGPQVTGGDDFRELQATAHGVEVFGYWGQAVTGVAEAKALLAETGARGLAGDLFVDGSLGSRTAWLTEPYLDAPDGDDHTGVCHLEPEAVYAHLAACTEAGVTAGFHVIGDAAVAAVIGALERTAERFGGPAVARCGHRLEHLEMVSPQQARMLGQWGVIASMQPSFDALWGGPAGMYAHRLGPQRAVRLNPFALLAAEGVPLAFGSDSPVTGIDPWAAIRAATRHHTPGSAISPRSAFTAATRGGWRAAGVDDGVTGTLVPGAPASYAVWEVDELRVVTPDDAVQRWSTDPRSRVPPLPPLDPDVSLPRCRQTVHRGEVLHDRE